jgi:hypothetical protein
MMRWAIIFSAFAVVAVVGMSGGIALAGEESGYVMDAHATTRPDGKIAVVVQIRGTASQSSAASPEIISAPRLEIWKGQGATAEEATIGPRPGSVVLKSTKVEVISMTGEDAVVVVARIVRDGKTVWADGEKVPILP